MPHAPPAGAQTLLRGLTAAQADAVRHGEGPLLLLAGPGVGKTHTLITRIAYLLATGRATAREIVAVTFTVRAAGELRLRLIDLLGEEGSRGLTAVTFHALCARVLREQRQAFGRTARFSIYDQTEVGRVVDQVLSQLDGPARSRVRIGADEVQHLVSLAKNRLLTPERLAARGGEPAWQAVAEAWRAVEAELRSSNAFDLDDLLYRAVQLLADDPAALARYRRRWRWLLVDEFQDINHAQNELVSLLAGLGGNLTVVGDDDQVLYSWRGARAEHILGFERRFPAHRTIVLERNFRSRAEILGAARRAVAHNPVRVRKPLTAARGTGGVVEVRGLGDEVEESQLARARIAAALANGTGPDDVLVLARAAYVTVPTQEALAAAGIRYRVLGSLGLFERSEVKDALAYLTLLVNPADAQAFRRALQAPPRGLGAVSVGRVIELARGGDGDLIAACTSPRGLAAAPAAARAPLAGFGAELERVRRELRSGRSLGHTAVETVTIEGGLVRTLEARGRGAASEPARRDAERGLEDLRSLCRAVQAFEREHDRPTLGGFLDYAAGLHAQEIAAGQDDRITISTIHRAKGTEARLVLVLGCEERLLPSWRAIETSDPDALAEERRLFYVALTRAKDRAVLTYAAARCGRPTGGPSRFLAEAGLSAAQHLAA